MQKSPARPNAIAAPGSSTAPGTRSATLPLREREADSAAPHDWLIALARQGTKYSIRLNNLGGYSSIRLSVTFPREWFGQEQGGAIGPVRVRAVANSLISVEAFAWVLFGLAVLVYAFTRFYKLDEFPINFFADEAVVVTTARNLLANGFNDPHFGLFPLYFDFFFVVNPLISVYAHALTIPLFGVSITVARATSALLTVFGAVAVAFTLKQFFNARYWWTALLFLAITPTWFLHSRTVLDTATATALYGVFIFCYLLYRYRSPRYALVVVLAAAGVFYSYPAAQLVLALTVALLALSDLRYHLQQIRIWLFAVPLIALVLVPYARFVIQYPSESWYHLRSVNSYVVQDLPVTTKLEAFVERYAQALSPQYWFLQNEVDLIRHRMKDYGHLPLVELPLLVVGLGVSIARFRESRYRVLIIALASAPIGAALTDILILRLLALVIPATLLTVVGLEFLFDRFARRFNPQLIGLLLFAALSAGAVWMTRDALVNGPRWFDQYDLYGMQWGARQLFDALKTVRRQSPKSPIILTSSWANGTEIFIEFFMPDDPLMTTRTVNAWIDNQEPLSRNTIFVMTPTEYHQALDSGKFQKPDVLWRLKYPNGTNAFYLVRLEYVPNVADMFRQERAARAQPITEQVEVNGETIKVTHSRFDSGEVRDMFDGDEYSLARSLEANPLVIELEYPTPRPLSSLNASFGQMPFKATVSLFAPDATTPVVYSQTDETQDPIPHLVMSFDNPPPLVQRVRIEIQHLDSPGDAKIHVRELQLK